LENIERNKKYFFSFTEPYGDEMTVLYLVEICRFTCPTPNPISGCLNHVH
jgi:hypothetical protein